jgi:hypothetical protein
LTTNDGLEKYAYQFRRFTLARQLVSMEALSTEMTDMLQKKVGRTDCSLYAPNPWSHPDPDGSNWDGGEVTCAGCRIDELLMVQEIIIDCRRRYNIL